VWEWGVGKGQRHHLVEEHAERPDVRLEAVRFAVDHLNRSGSGKGGEDGGRAGGEDMIGGERRTPSDQTSALRP
jgi:hypothetical protein